MREEAVSVLIGTRGLIGAAKVRPFAGELGGAAL